MENPWQYLLNMQILKGVIIREINFRVVKQGSTHRI